MTKKECVIDAIQRKPVDRIPATFRASKYLTTTMKHSSFKDPVDFTGNREKFLELLGADYWSSGTKVDKFSTFTPEFLGEKPKPPYVDDGTYFYTIGIRSRPGNMKSYDIDYPHIGMDPPLAGVSSHADLKLVDHIVGEVGDFCLEFNRRSLEVIGNEAVYYGTWDDVAGQDGLLFSPELFKKDKHF